MIISYAEQLADAYGVDDPDQEERDGSHNERALDDHGDEFPDDVPSRATLTRKEINDNEYSYYQWSDGGKTRSEYKGPGRRVKTR